MVRNLSTPSRRREPSSSSSSVQCKYTTRQRLNASRTRSTTTRNLPLRLCTSLSESKAQFLDFTKETIVNAKPHRVLSRSKCNGDETSHENGCNKLYSQFDVSMVFNEKASKKSVTDEALNRRCVRNKLTLRNNTEQPDGIGNKKEHREKFSCVSRLNYKHKENEVLESKTQLSSRLSNSSDGVTSPCVSNPRISSSCITKQHISHPGTLNSQRLSNPRISHRRDSYCSNLRSSKSRISNKVKSNLCLGKPCLSQKPISSDSRPCIFSQKAPTKRYSEESISERCLQSSHATSKANEKFPTRKYLSNFFRNGDTFDNESNSEVEGTVQQSTIIKPVFRYIKCRTCRVPCDKNLINKLKIFESGNKSKDAGTGGDAESVTVETSQEECAVIIQPENGDGTIKCVKSLDKIKNAICNSFSIKIVNELSSFSSYLDHQVFLDNTFSSSPIGEDVALENNEANYRSSDELRNDVFDGILNHSPCDENKTSFLEVDEHTIVDRLASLGCNKTFLKDENDNIKESPKGKHQLNPPLSREINSKDEVGVPVDSPRSLSGEIYKESKDIVGECVHCESNDRSEYSSCECCAVASKCISKCIMESIGRNLVSRCLYYCGEHRHLHCRKHVRLKNAPGMEHPSHYCSSNSKGSYNNNIDHSSITNTNSNEINIINNNSIINKDNYFNHNYILQSTGRLNLLRSHTISPSTSSTSSHTINLMLEDIDLDIEIVKDGDQKRNNLNEHNREKNIESRVNRVFHSQHTRNINKLIRYNRGEGSRLGKKEKEDRIVNVSVSQFMCEWHNCHKEFETNNKLVRHLKQIHLQPMLENNDEAFMCLWRKCKFNSQPSSSCKWISKHVVRHCSNRPFKCMISGCASSYATQNGLARHVPSHFNGGKVRRTCVLTSVEKDSAAEFSKIEVIGSSVENSEDESVVLVKRRTRCEKFVDAYKRSSSESGGEKSEISNDLKKRLQLQSSLHPNNCQCGFVGNCIRINHQIVGKRTSSDGSVDVLLSPSSSKMFPLKSFWYDGRILEESAELSDGKSLSVDVKINQLSADIKQQIYDDEQIFNLFKRRNRYLDK